jgi:hypothetical protein
VGLTTSRSTGGKIDANSKPPVIFVPPSASSKMIEAALGRRRDQRL